MAMKEAPHGGIIKKPVDYSPIENRTAPDEYGLLSDSRINVGGLVTPPAHYNGIEEPSKAGGIKALYVHPITFVPDHGGVFQTPEGYGAPIPGDQQ
jgi:hypothetical protein